MENKKEKSPLFLTKVTIVWVGIEDFIFQVVMSSDILSKVECAEHDCSYLS
jgi:hypothetical protein